MLPNIAVFHYQAIFLTRRDSGMKYLRDKEPLTADGRESKFWVIVAGLLALFIAIMGAAAGALWFGPVGAVVILLGAVIAYFAVLTGAFMLIGALTQESWVSLTKAFVGPATSSLSALFGGDGDGSKSESPGRSGQKPSPKPATVNGPMPTSIVPIYTIANVPWNPDDFDTALSVLEQEFHAPNGAFVRWGGAYRQETSVHHKHLLDAGLDLLLYACSRIGPGSQGKANLWVCHSVDELRGRPDTLRSGLREGYFPIGQLVQPDADAGLRYRFNSVYYDVTEARQQALVSALVLVECRPIVRRVEDAGSEDDAERRMGTTHILGIPLWHRNVGRSVVESEPVSITVDFSIINGAIDTNLLYDRAHRLIDVAEALLEFGRWRGIAK